MQTILTARTAALPAILLAVSTQALAHEGHDHAIDNNTSVPFGSQDDPPESVIDEAPPFETLPPGHSLNDGHNHSGDKSRRQFNPPRSQSWIHSPTETYPFYQSLNRRGGRFESGPDQFQQAPLRGCPHYRANEWNQHIFSPHAITNGYCGGMPFESCWPTNSGFCSTNRHSPVGVEYPHHASSVLPFGDTYYPYVQPACPHCGMDGAH